MSFQIRVADAADGEADAIADWLAVNVSVAYAAAWYRGLMDAIERLVEFPRMYPLIADERPGGPHVVATNPARRGVDELDGAVPERFHRATERSGWLLGLNHG